MKVLMINGSPRPNANTLIAFKEMTDIFDKEGIEYEIMNITEATASSTFVANEPARANCIQLRFCAYLLKSMISRRIVG